MKSPPNPNPAVPPPGTDSQPAIATEGPATPGPEAAAKPEIAHSQPAIAGSEAFLWWEHRVDLAALARIRAHKGQETLDWARSVVDLLTLAGQDHSEQARRWMAEKLQWPGDVPDDPKRMSAEMNAWLCTRLKAELVKHGSQMPQPKG